MKRQARRHGIGAWVLRVGFALAPALGAGAPWAPAQAFYVYTEQGSLSNHFPPSGFMGDYGDLSVDQAAVPPKEGRTCIRIRYRPRRSQRAGWAGVYWQQPAGNWGQKPGGFDLTGFSRLTFWARGAFGGERITAFKVGGIPAQTERGDSDIASTGPIVLDSSWKEYSIDLRDKDLSYIIGGFCVTVNADDNVHGVDVYLDEIRYE